MQKSSDITILTDSAIQIPGHWTNGEPYITAEEIKEVLGWEVKPEGLCKEDACIPINEEKDIEDQGHYNLRQIANLTGHPALVSSETQTVAIGQLSALRTSALRDKVAPDFKLPDIDGVDRALSDWAGKKRLLVAFSSW
ncbi:MAG: hypothetical protein CL431_00200 [Acidimicrobiaceae bacterium]|jgi:hypothetical protein|nr:hypothetical protein [Acidimicrobiaceae bacterium]|tara:strand:- start:13373 stop:13789 length:417 start_codon:yes stop_codon:yes gene_type:complete